MSAFICSDEHIAEITAHIARSITPQADLAGRYIWPMFNALREENVRSVCYRYRDLDFDEEIAALDHDFDPVDYAVNRVRFSHPAAIYKLAACLDYQSCEHPGWEESEAGQALAAVLAETKPFAKPTPNTHSPVFKSTPWGYSPDKEVA